jgi:chaperonin GroEL
MLEDIATLSGGQVISEDLFTKGWGIKLENVTLDMLGRAKRARIDRENITINDGAGKKADIQGRVGQIESCPSPPSTGISYPPPHDPAL